MNDIHPCCLTIAGGDSGGNAGIQADLRAFHAYGLHGCTVFTALTAQNPEGVRAVHPLPPAFVADQLDAVFDLYSVAALKTGMLADAAVIETVAAKLRARPDIAKVVDPVMIATSGAPLIAPGAVDALKKKLLPLARVITPNIPEAESLTGIRIDSPAAARDAAERLHGETGAAVLVKGGHADGAARADDLLFDGRDFAVFSLPRIADPVSVHGTGCTLAAALAAELARGAGLHAAVDGAKRHVHAAIAGSFRVGPDCGVLGFVTGQRFANTVRQ